MLTFSSALALSSGFLQHVLLLIDVQDRVHDGTRMPAAGSRGTGVAIISSLVSPTFAGLFSLFCPQLPPAIAQCVNDFIMAFDPNLPADQPETEGERKKVQAQEETEEREQTVRQD